MVICVPSNTVLFYGCILFLLFRTNIHDLIRIFKRFVNSMFRGDHLQDLTFLLDLPIIQFEDLQTRRRHSSFDETCFICLKEYEKYDILTQLRCNHVYHTECIGTLMNDYELCCPFCKSSIFKVMCIT